MDNKKTATELAEYIIEIVTGDKPDPVTLNTVAIMLGDWRGSRSDAEQFAKLFHETYERLAPEHGYETRKESAVSWDDVPENNKNLMVATCKEVLSKADREAAPFKNLIELKGWAFASGFTYIESNPEIYILDDSKGNTIVRDCEAGRFLEICGNLRQLLEATRADAVKPLRAQVRYAVCAECKGHRRKELLDITGRSRGHVGRCVCSGKGYDPTTATAVIKGTDVTTAEVVAKISEGTNIFELMTQISHPEKRFTIPHISEAIAYELAKRDAEIEDYANHLTELAEKFEVKDARIAELEERCEAFEEAAGVFSKKLDEAHELVLGFREILISIEPGIQSFLDTIGGSDLKERVRQPQTNERNIGNIIGKIPDTIGGSDEN